MRLINSIGLSLENVSEKENSATKIEFRKKIFNKLSLNILKVY